MHDPSPSSPMPSYARKLETFETLADFFGLPKTPLLRYDAMEALDAYIAASRLHEIMMVE